MCIRDSPSTVGFASLQEQVQLRFVFAEEIPFTEALDRYLSPLVDFSLSLIHI